MKTPEQIILKELAQDIQASSSQKIQGIRLLSLAKISQTPNKDIFIYEGEEKNIFDVVVGVDEFVTEISRRSALESKKMEEKSPEIANFNKFMGEIRHKFLRLCDRVQAIIFQAACPQPKCFDFLEKYKNGEFDTKESLRTGIESLCLHLKKDLMEGQETGKVDMAIREMKNVFSKTLDMFQEYTDKFEEEKRKIVRLEMEEKPNELSSWMTQSGRGLVYNKVAPVFYCLADCGEVQARKINGLNVADFHVYWKRHLNFLPADNDNHLNCIDVSPDGKILAISECKTKRVHFLSHEGKPIAILSSKEKDKDEEIRLWRVCWWTNNVLALTYNDKSFLKVALDVDKLLGEIKNDPMALESESKMSRTEGSVNITQGRISEKSLTPRFFDDFGQEKLKLFLDYGCMETLSKIDEDRILFGGVSGSLIILNGDLDIVFEMRGVIKPHKKRIHDMVVCEAGKSVITSSEDKTVKRICLLTKAILWSVDLPQECFEIAVDFSEFFVLIGYSNGKNIYGVSIVSLGNGTVLDTIPTKTSIKSVIPFRGQENAFISSFKIHNSLAKFVCKF